MGNAVFTFGVMDAWARTPQVSRRELNEKLRKVQRSTRRRPERLDAVRGELSRDHAREVRNRAQKGQKVFRVARRAFRLVAANLTDGLWNRPCYVLMARRDRGLAR